MNQVSLAISFKKKLSAFSLQKQKEVMAVIAQLMLDETLPSLKLHKTQRGDWWTAYVDGDIRVVLKREGSGVIYVAHVDHHEAAYQWAERNKLCKHPVTGTLQIVEIPQISAKPVVSAPTQTPKKKSKPFVEVLKITREELFNWGVPEEWLAPLMCAATQDEVLDIALHLPADVAEIAMAIGEGKRPTFDEETTTEDRNQQAWHIVSSDEELNRMLNETWDLWAVYLHPAQRAIAERRYSGAARVGGSAGTGKTVVLLHHAKYLLRNNDACTILITTFSNNLATDLSYRLGALLVPTELERCDTRAFYDFGQDCYRKFICKQNPPTLLDREQMRELVLDVAQSMELPSGIHPLFICSEWEKIVDIRNITTWEDYRDAKRRNVTIRLAVSKREAIWKVFEAVYAKLKAEHSISQGMMFGALAEWYKTHPHGRRYDYLLVDESQDLGEVELDFLAAYNQRADGLFFAGDIGQRVCRYTFPWSQHGIDLRGKSKTLKVNYRTTQEIRKFADKLVTLSQTDADGEEHNRTQTVSLLRGPTPELKEFDTPEEEIKAVTEWLNRLKHEKNIAPANVAIFVRSENELERAISAYHASDYHEDKIHRCKIATMEEAKGLEYQAVVVMACDCDVLPLPERLAEKDIVASIDEIYDTERNLFYVACTRARDYLLVTCGDVPSEFLLDVL